LAFFDFSFLASGWLLLGSSAIEAASFLLFSFLAFFADFSSSAAGWLLLGCSAAEAVLLFSFLAFFAGFPSSGAGWLLLLGSPAHMQGFPCHGRLLSDCKAAA
jgi:hypothetical protein